MIHKVFQLVLTLVLSLGGASALAWEGVHVLVADGRVEHLNFGSGGMAPE